jgi:hypothetical protein
MKDIYTKINGAREYAEKKETEILAIAKAIGLHYSDSKGEQTTWEEIKNCLAVLCFEAEKQFYKNCESGTPEKPVSISSGGWTVRIDFWESGTTVNIYFGFCNYGSGSN